MYILHQCLQGLFKEGSNIWFWSTTQLFNQEYVSIEISVCTGNHAGNVLASKHDMKVLIQWKAALTSCCCLSSGYGSACCLSSGYGSACCLSSGYGSACCLSSGYGIQTADLICNSASTSCKIEDAGLI